MPAKNKAKVEKDGAERWLLTYADLMNLLLIFFIILYSMSQLDSQKFSQLAASLKSTLGISVPGSLIPNSGAGQSLMPIVPVDPPESSAENVQSEEQLLEELKSEVKALIDDQDLQGDVDVSMEDRGVVVSVTAHMLFKSGSAAIENDAVPIIESIGKILLTLPKNNIRVEGHTDDDPINTPLFPSNWELSSSRATNVLRLLVDKSGINPASISSVGYGQYRPKFPNDTIENKASNRRVDIVIIRSMYDKSEAGKN